MTTRVRLTYEDYAALPDDGRRYELHEGELSVTPGRGQPPRYPRESLCHSPGLEHPGIVQ
jgi:hypothetical protein